MRTPSFVSTSRMPSAFGAATAPAGAARLRPAGDTIDPTCNNNTYHGVRFYDANQNCIDINQTITGQMYNEYGYPIDHYGVPQLNGGPASWAQLGAHGQAWVQPDTGTMLDTNGNVLTQGQIAGTNYNLVSNCPTDANGNVLARNSSGQLAMPPASSVGCDAGGRAVDANGSIIPDSQYGQLINPAAVTPTTNILTPINPNTPQNQSLYNAIGPALNTTGQAISTAIASNNQQQIAQMQNATALQIAQMQMGVQQANAQGNLQLAQQRLQQMGPLLQFQAQLQAASSQQIAFYVVGAIVALGIIGAVVYFNQSGSVQAAASQPASAPTSVPASRRTARNNPFTRHAGMKNPFAPLTSRVHAVGSLRRRHRRSA